MRRERGAGSARGSSSERPEWVRGHWGGCQHTGLAGMGSGDLKVQTHYGLGRKKGPCTRAWKVGLMGWSHGG